MGNYLKVEIKITDLENILALCIDAELTHLKPLIVWLVQNARTETEAIQLRNALDAREDIEHVRRILASQHPHKDTQ